MKARLYEVFMLFDGLNLFEWVLLVLGVVLFIALLVSFVYQIMHARSVTGLLAFFAIPILMIGYSSVKSYAIGKVTVTLKDATKDLQANPGDQELRAKVEQQVAQLDDRSFSDPDALVTLSEAQFALGREHTAENNLKKALQASPHFPAAQALKHKHSHG
jgi:hypothetical protein